MHPKDQIQQDFKTAMKAGETRKREVLRLLMAAFKQVEVDRRMSEAKKRREAIDEMDKAGRTELADNERYELGLIESYLPQQLGLDELRTLVQEVIREVGATTPKDIGSVMKALMPRIKGQADGRQVNAIVQDLLSK